VGEELSQAIALATAWDAGEVDTWTELAGEAIASHPLQALRQIIITKLAKTIAEQAGGDWSVSTVLQHLALDADEDGGQASK